MNIKFKTIKPKELFNKDNFSITFDIDNYELSTVVYLSNVNTIQLEESNLIIKTYIGEYWYYDRRIELNVSILLEHYFIYSEYDNYNCIITYKD